MFSRANFIVAERLITKGANETPERLKNSLAKAWPTSLNQFHKVRYSPLKVYRQLRSFKKGKDLVMRLGLSAHILSVGL